jgi:lanosterol synthase
MALMYAKYPDPEPIEKGVRLVMSRQRPVSLFEIQPLLLILNSPFQDGSWPQEAIEGVFNKTCAIAYPNFKFSFPIWMLGKAHYYLTALKSESTIHGMANGSGNGHMIGRP